MTELLQKVHKYQNYLETNPNGSKVPYIFTKFAEMPITIETLQTTGLGRVVNSFKKIDGEIGNMAKCLVSRWKTMVNEEALRRAQVESDNDEGEDDDDDNEDGEDDEEESEAGDDAEEEAVKGELDKSCSEAENVSWDEDDPRHLDEKSHFHKNGNNGERNSKKSSHLEGNKSSRDKGTSSKTSGRSSSSGKSVSHNKHGKTDSTSATDKNDRHVRHSEKSDRKSSSESKSSSHDSRVKTSSSNKSSGNHKTTDKNSDSKAKANNSHGKTSSNKTVDKHLSSSSASKQSHQGHSHKEKASTKDEKTKSKSDSKNKVDMNSSAHKDLVQSAAAEAEKLPEQVDRSKEDEEGADRPAEVSLKRVDRSSLDDELFQDVMDLESDEERETTGDTSFINQHRPALSREDNSALLKETNENREGSKSASEKDLAHVPHASKSSRKRSRSSSSSSCDDDSSSDDEKEARKHKKAKKKHKKKHSKSKKHKHDKEGKHGTDRHSDRATRKEPSRHSDSATRKEKDLGMESESRKDVNKEKDKYTAIKERDSKQKSSNEEKHKSSRDDKKHGSSSSENKKEKTHSSSSRHKSRHGNKDDKDEKKNSHHSSKQNSDRKSHSSKHSSSGKQSTSRAKDSSKKGEADRSGKDDDESKGEDDNAQTVTSFEDMLSAPDEQLTLNLRNESKPYSQMMEKDSYEKLKSKFKIKKRGAEEPKSQPAKKPKVESSRKPKVEPEISPSKTADLLGSLPVPNTHYRPQRINNVTKKHIEADQGEEFQYGMKQNTRTQMYSGRKHKSVPEVYRLQDMCINILGNNIDSIEWVGGVPFYILKSVIEKCTPAQLYRLEDFNPQFLEDTDYLWKQHCQKEFRNCDPEEMETWRELYLRKHDEREAKLKAVSANISMTKAKAEPVRTTKLAYVDGSAKPPRDVRRQQLKYGTAGGSSGGKAHRFAASMDCVPLGKPSAKVAKPVAPMMAKTMAMIKKMRR